MRAIDCELCSTDPLGEGAENCLRGYPRGEEAKEKDTGWGAQSLPHLSLNQGRYTLEFRVIIDL